MDSKTVEDHTAKISVKFMVKQLAISCQSISLFLRAPVNIFRNQAQYGSKKTCIAFGYIALKKKVFSCVVG